MNYERLAKTENLIADIGERFLEIENRISELKLKTAKLDDLEDDLDMHNENQ